jgi:hypothetical protein
MKITIPTSILFWLAAMAPTSTAETQTFNIVGTDVPIGGIDPFSEGSTVSAAGPWGPTYSLGPGHPWQNGFGGVIAPSWINVYPSFFQGLNTVSWVRIRFTMPSEFSSASFNLKMKNDNKGDVSINDNFLATITTAGERNFGVGSEEATWLRPGENVITMTLTDTGGWVGYQYVIELNFDATGGAELIPAGTPVVTAVPSARPSSAPIAEPSSSPSSAPSFESVSHEVCQNFAVHARTTVTFDGVTSKIYGADVGVSPGTSITGSYVFRNEGPSTGHVVQDSSVFADSVLTAHSEAMQRPSEPMAIEIGGRTFTPGTYRSGSAINFAYGTVVTLDGQDQANPVFLFQAGSTLVTAANTYFILKNGAKAENVVWALGTAATLGANSVLEGSILAGTAITFGTKSELHGCALAQSAVTFESAGSIKPNHYLDDGPGNNLRG